VRFLLDQIKPEQMKPLKIVANPGNGCAGLVASALEGHLPFDIVRVHFEPDGNLPNGIPNPLLPENRDATAAAVRENNADFGVAWDGDFDRCFFFDERGEFIEGYYIVGLIAEMLLKMNPGAAIVHDPRLTWNTLAQVEENGGKPVQSKSGHSFMKQTMREVDALYGGEMSAHHYFRDFSYADNGHLPWLVLAQLISETGKPLSTLVEERIAAFPASGEINREIGDPDAALADLESHYGASAEAVEHVDGLSMDFGDWRFNLRKSNTEPVVRLNVEARGDIQLMHDKTDELLERLSQH
jgi:phosphomannomutase